MAHERHAAILAMALCHSAIAGAVAPSLSRDPQGLDPCGSAGAAVEAEETRPLQGPGGDSGIFVDVPTGTVCVGPETLEGGPAFTRLTKAKEGMAIVEVSDTPFMAEAGSGAAVAAVALRPDLPAPW